MKKVLIVLGFFIIFNLIITQNAKAFTTIKSEDGTGNVTIKSSEVINDNVATAGNNITISGVINDDLFIAGQNIIIDGEIKGTLFAAGAQITIAGKVDKDLIALANQVQIDNNAVIGRDIVAGANLIDINGIIQRNAWLGASSIKINNNIGGNVKTSTSSMIFGSNGKITGALTYYSDKKININENLITGGVNFQENTPAKETSSQSKLLQWFYGLIASILVGLLLILLMPKWTKMLALEIQKGVLKNFGIGFLILIVVPIIALISLITIIGIPIALILTAIYLVLLYLAKFWVAYCLGNYITKEKSNPFLAITLGIVIIELILLIPVFGWIAGFAITLIGLGVIYSINLFKNAR